MDGNPERKALGACDWCGKDAYQRLTLRPGANTAKGYRVAKTALVCPVHHRHFSAQDEISFHVKGEEW